MKVWKNEVGQYHREDGPAIIWDDGDKEWYMNGERHRTNGPAIMWAGYQVWYQKGKLHRIDGPAYISKDAQNWYVEDKYINDHVSSWMTENDIPTDYTKWNDTHRVLFRLSF